MTEKDLINKQRAKGLRLGATPGESLQQVLDDMRRILRKTPEPDEGKSNRRDALLRASGIAVRHQTEALNEQIVPRALVRWADRFPGSLKEGNVLLAGPTGTGKTCAAVWALLRALEVASVRFIAERDLVAHLFEHRSLRTFERFDLLVIDDWGEAYEHDWPLAAIDGLIDRRWLDMRATIVTTNLPPTKASAEKQKVDPRHSFEGRYPRAFSRLCDAGGPGLVFVNGPDRRRARA